MNDTNEDLNPDWSHDPRSEAAHEKHLEVLSMDFTPDEKIKEKALMALYLNPEVDGSHISIDVNDGVVSLRGFVKDRMEKIQAQKSVEELKSVEDIQNLLEIKPKRVSTFS